jgi:hypothetical protein
MEQTNWAFLDDNWIVIHLAEGNITTMEFYPQIVDSYSHMVRCYANRGHVSIGMKYNWETDKFE